MRTFYRITRVVKHEKQAGLFTDQFLCKEQFFCFDELKWFWAHDKYHGGKECTTEEQRTIWLELARLDEPCAILTSFQS